MKSVFISYNQAYHEEIIELLGKLSLRGYTYWEVTQGRGSATGDPHLGSHAWPTLNSSLLVIVPADKVPTLLERLKAMDEETPAQGLRAFVWAVEASIEAPRPPPRLTRVLTSGLHPLQAARAVYIGIGAEAITARGRAHTKGGEAPRGRPHQSPGCAAL